MSKVGNTHRRMLLLALLLPLAACGASSPPATQADTTVQADPTQAFCASQRPLFLAIHNMPPDGNWTTNDLKVVNAALKKSAALVSADESIGLTYAVDNVATSVAFSNQYQAVLKDLGAGEDASVDTALLVSDLAAVAKPC